MKTHKLASALFILFTAVTFLLVGFIGFLMVTHTQPYAVQSDSMAPEFRKGDAVFVRRVDTADLHAGDIVTVRSSDGSRAFTHRITRIDTEQTLVYTKGDNSPSEDSMPAVMSMVAGRVWFSLPYLGTVSAAAQSRTFLIILALIAIFLTFVRISILAVKKFGKGGGKNAAQKN